MNSAISVSKFAQPPSILSRQVDLPNQRHILPCIPVYQSPCSSTSRHSTALHSPEHTISCFLHWTVGQPVHKIWICASINGSAAAFHKTFWVIIIGTGSLTFVDFRNDSRIAFVCTPFHQASLCLFSLVISFLITSSRRYTEATKNGHTA